MDLIANILSQDSGPLRTIWPVYCQVLVSARNFHKNTGTEKSCYLPGTAVIKKLTITSFVSAILKRGAVKELKNPFI